MYLKRSLPILSILVVLGMLLSACTAPSVVETEAPSVTSAPAETASVPTAVVETNPWSELSGDIVVDGSSTVYPVTTAVAEEFAKIAPNVRISVGLSGTGGGFKMFCPGETDISDASRPIKDSEMEICKENKVEYVEFVVALDGLTVMVNPENDWLESLTVEQLAQLLGSTSTIKNWSDLDPNFPDEEISFFIPDPDSGTRDYMTEIVTGVTGDEDLRQDENTTFSSDDNVLLDGIANEKYAFGFFGYAYYVGNQDTVRAIPIVNESGEAVLPSDTTVQDGSYNPLSRPLFIYVNKASLLEKPQVAAFVEFFFTEGGALKIMGDVGYSLPPSGTYESNLDLLSSALAGTMPDPTAVVETNPWSELSGDIVVDGSSTVYPVTTAVAEEFAKIAPNVRISVGLSGTGGGFKMFCPGETDISDASRPIKDSEMEICKENKVEYVEFVVALDGLTVMVNPENDWLESLTVEQLAQLLGSTSTIKNWSDLDPNFPDEEISFFIPDPDSGTRDYMTEIVTGVTGDEDLRQDENTTFSSDDNVLLDGIANEKYAFGFFGYAYYVGNQDTVRAIPIVNESGEAVLPSDTTVQDGSYNPLSRPLFIYVNKASLLEKPQVAAFVEFFFTEGGALKIMGDVGYSLPPSGTYESNLDLLSSTIK